MIPFEPCQYFQTGREFIDKGSTIARIATTVRNNIFDWPRTDGAIILGNGHVSAYFWEVVPAPVGCQFFCSNNLEHALAKVCETRRKRIVIYYSTDCQFHGVSKLTKSADCGSRFSFEKRLAESPTRIVVWTDEC